MVKLGVNIDHVATLRQARKEEDPDPLLAAAICEQSGADSIVAHLREDRRHIQDRDILLLRKSLKKRFNLEMSLAKGIVDLASTIKPQQVTIVPERRQEITTEGGLDVLTYHSRITKAIKCLHSQGIEISLFIAPNKKQIQATHHLGIKIIEIHTGAYARAFAQRKGDREYKKIVDMTSYASSLGLTVNAGHGLNYNNARPIAKIKNMHELNIGHSIISRSIFVGLQKAVREMLALINRVH